jgi:uncharacterized membrane protein YfcA
MAFLGGTITIDTGTYKTVLGILLLIPVTRFLFFPNIPVNEIRKNNIMISLCLGATIGLISGIIGIGGGIILSPVLLLLKWTDQKQTAAISSLFIFVNSLAGLIGQWTKGFHVEPRIYYYAGVALAGGLVGAYFGSMKFNQQVLRFLLALVLLFAAYKLIFTNA